MIDDSILEGAIFLQAFCWRKLFSTHHPDELAGFDGLHAVKWHKVMCADSTYVPIAQPNVRVDYLKKKSDLTEWDTDQETKMSNQERDAKLKKLKGKAAAVHGEGRMQQDLVLSNLMRERIHLKEQPNPWGTRERRRIKVRQSGRKGSQSRK